MDIKGDKIRLTPSEAHWAQIASVRFGLIPDLAQRIQDARIAHARQWLSEDELPTTVAYASLDAVARVRQVVAFSRLLEVELGHAPMIAARKDIPLRCRRVEMRGCVC